MASRLGNYLYVRRREWALTQKELAFLFGYTSDAIVSRLEGQARKIPLRIAFACELIFGSEPKELFPALFEQVEEGVVRRMYELYEQLKCAEPSKKTAAKLHLLHEALARVTSIGKPQEI